jgi:hypothetical protein
MGGSTRSSHAAASSARSCIATPLSGRKPGREASDLDTESRRAVTRACIVEESTSRAMWDSLSGADPRIAADLAPSADNPPGGRDLVQMSSSLGNRARTAAVSRAAALGCRGGAQRPPPGFPCCKKKRTSVVGDVGPDGRIGDKCRGRDAPPATSVYSQGQCSWPPCCGPSGARKE